MKPESSAHTDGKKPAAGETAVALDTAAGDSVGALEAAAGGPKRTGNIRLIMYSKGVTFFLQLPLFITINYLYVHLPVRSSVTNLDGDRFNIPLSSSSSSSITRRLKNNINKVLSTLNVHIQHVFAYFCELT